jgi:hypothetical protein
VVLQIGCLVVVVASGKKCLHIAKQSIDPLGFNLGKHLGKHCPYSNINGMSASGVDACEHGCDSIQDGCYTGQPQA